MQKEEVPSYKNEVEMPEKRTANSKVFQHENGSQKLEISAESIHYKDKKTKKWESIDNTLKKNKTGRYHNQKNAFDASFPSEITDANPLLSIQHDGKTVEITSMTKNGDKPAGNGIPLSTSITRNKGKISSYTTYDSNGVWRKQVRLEGKPHGSIPRPNVKVRKKNINKNTGQVFWGEKVRAAKRYEIPKP